VHLVGFITKKHLIRLHSKIIKQKAASTF